MKQSPYETMSCFGYDVEKIAQEIISEFKRNRYSQFFVELDAPIGREAYFIPSNIDFNPKAFPHPIDFEITQLQTEKFTVLDARPYTKISQNYEPVFTRVIDMDLAKRRTILHAIWASSDIHILQNMTDALMQVFSAWISESICKRLEVDAITQLKIANIAAFWFWCQCNKEEDLTPATLPKVHRLISDATRSNFDTVEADLLDIEYFDDLGKFAEEVSSRTGSATLRNLDAATIIQLANTGWIGTLAKEIMSVAIEYPPYLMAVVYTALHERGMRSAPFTKLVQRFQTRPELRGFKNSIDHLGM